jgi:predicted amidohydrolase
MRVAAAAAGLFDGTPATWVARVRAQVRAAADAGAGLIVLPEYVTAPLLASDPRWSAWDGLWRDTAVACAREHRLLVCAGTHLVHEADGLRNRCLLAWPDGSTDHQDKLHPTPCERTWGVVPTATIRLFSHAGACLAVPICYDIEFPEATRAAAAAGAEVLLLPSWTDDAAGFWRVRHCAQARCVENVLYAVHAPMVGAQSAPPGFEQGGGAAGVLTPCDTGFPRAGLAVAGGWNQPEVVVADLDLERLRRQRTAGTVTPFSDRRAGGDYAVAPT